MSLRFTGGLGLRAAWVYGQHRKHQFIAIDGHHLMVASNTTCDQLRLAIILKNVQSLPIAVCSFSGAAIKKDPLSQLARNFAFMIQRVPRRGIVQRDPKFSQRPYRSILNNTNNFIKCPAKLIAFAWGLNFASHAGIYTTNPNGEVCD